MIFDYFALLVSRYVMGCMQWWRSAIAILTLLIVDLILTGALGMLPNLAMYVFDGPGSHSIMGSYVLEDTSVISSFENFQGTKNYYGKEEQETLAEMQQMQAAYDARILETERERTRILGEMKTITKDRGPGERLLDSLDHNEKSLKRHKQQNSNWANQMIEFDRSRVGEAKDILLEFLVSFWLPGFFTSIWLWLYAGSGFLLKAARRFDIGFDWFNRKCDIEKKPLQLIGLVAGAIVALCYLSVALVSRVL